MFYTPVTLHPLHWNINLKDPVLTAGSCFADCMGRNFQSNKFQVLANPFGTVYNPISLHEQFLMAIKNQTPSVDNLVKTQEMYFHYQFHSSFVNPNPDQLINDLKEQIASVHKFLSTAEYFIITWGTAWTYKRKDKNEIVANCQKQPQKLFDKILLNNEEVQNDFALFYNKLKEFNPKIKLVLTLSPVRHIKDTLPLNMVSKSVLRVAAYNISKEYKDVFYFPAYEIMLDELRDYRYYKEDMIHPTPQAEDYIWNRFKEVAFDKETVDFISQWQDIQKSITHKPFNPSSEAHQKFLLNTIQKLELLNGKVDVRKEIGELKRQVI